MRQKKSLPSLHQCSEAHCKKIDIRRSAVTLDTRNAWKRFHKKITNLFKVRLTILWTTRLWERPKIKNHSIWEDDWPSCYLGISWSQRFLVNSWKRKKKKEMKWKEGESRRAHEASAMRAAKDLSDSSPITDPSSVRRHFNAFASSFL